MGETSKLVLCVFLAVATGAAVLKTAIRMKRETRPATAVSRR